MKKRVSDSPVPFQSTLLMRGATGLKMDADLDVEFQSTLLMRGAT